LTHFPILQGLMGRTPVDLDAPRLQEHLERLAEEDPTLRFTADVARGIWTLREVLEERAGGKTPSSSRRRPWISRSRLPRAATWVRPDDGLPADCF
jgi:hypothetical protein